MCNFVSKIVYTLLYYALLSTQSEEIQNVLSPKPQEQNLFSETDKSPNFAYDLLYIDVERSLNNLTHFLII